MTEKTIFCCHCNIERELCWFSFRNKSKNLYHSHCKICQREYSNRHYSLNKEDYKERAKDWVTNNIELRKVVAKLYEARQRATKFCKCCTKEKFIEYYLKCPQGWHVDHIQKLSDNGWHCVDNLQYLSPSEHIRKNMWERYYG